MCLNVVLCSWSFHSAVAGVCVCVCVCVCVRAHPPLDSCDYEKSGQNRRLFPA